MYIGPLCSQAALSACRSSGPSAGAITVMWGMARITAMSSTDWCVLPVLPVRMPEYLSQSLFLCPESRVQSPKSSDFRLWILYLPPAPNPKSKIQNPKLLAQFLQGLLQLLRRGHLGVPLERPRHEGYPLALYRVRDDYRGLPLVRLRRLARLKYLLHLMAVDLDRLPSER